MRVVRTLAPDRGSPRYVCLRRRHLLARMGTPSLTHTHWHRLGNCSRRSAISGPNGRGYLPYRVRARDGKGRRQMPVGTRTQPDLAGVILAISDYSGADEIPAPENALRDRLITGLPD